MPIKATVTFYRNINQIAVEVEEVHSQPKTKKAHYISWPDGNSPMMDNLNNRGQSFEIKLLAMPMGFDDFEMKLKATSYYLGQKSADYLNLIQRGCSAQGLREEYAELSSEEKSQIDNYKKEFVDKRTQTKAVADVLALAGYYPPEKFEKHSAIPVLILLSHIFRLAEKQIHEKREEILLDHSMDLLTKIKEIINLNILRIQNDSNWLEARGNKVSSDNYYDLENVKKILQKNDESIPSLLKQVLPNIQDEFLKQDFQLLVALIEKKKMEITKKDLSEKNLKAINLADFALEIAPLQMTPKSGEEHHDADELLISPKSKMQDPGELPTVASSAKVEPPVSLVDANLIPVAKLESVNEKESHVVVEPTGSDRSFFNRNNLFHPQSYYNKDNTEGLKELRAKKVDLEMVASMCMDSGDVMDKEENQNGNRSSLRP